MTFISESKLVGEYTKNINNKASSNPLRTIHVIKRLSRRKFDDKEVQRDLKMVPYKVVSQQGKPYVSVDTKDGGKTLSPEEVSAMVLSKMKNIAESYLG